MKQFPEVIRRVMRRNLGVKQFVGEDKDGEIKVYNGVVKSGVKPPYVFMNIIPNAIAPTSLYGEKYGIISFSVQVTSWAQTSKQVWELAGLVHEAIESNEYQYEDTVPYQLMIQKLTSWPQELPDRDTNLRQVVAVYDFAFSMEGGTT